LGDAKAQPAEKQAVPVPAAGGVSSPLRGAAQPAPSSVIQAQAKIAELIARLSGGNYTGKLVLELQMKAGGVASIAAMSNLPL
jgi:hypothetical protein